MYSSAALPYSYMQHYFNKFSKLIKEKNNLYREKPASHSLAHYVISR